MSVVSLANYKVENIFGVHTNYGYFLSGSVADGATSPVIQLFSMPAGKTITVTIKPASGAEVTTYTTTSDNALVAAEDSAAIWVQAASDSNMYSITSAVQDVITASLSGIYFKSISGAFDWEIRI